MPPSLDVPTLINSAHPRIPPSMSAADQPASCRRVSGRDYDEIIVAHDPDEGRQLTVDMSTC
jgi:hypothetical protein